MLQAGAFSIPTFQKGRDLIDTTYTIPLTETQYTTLLNKAAELDIPLEDLLLQAIQNQIKERDPHAWHEGHYRENPCGSSRRLGTGISVLEC